MPRRPRDRLLLALACLFALALPVPAQEGAGPQAFGIAPADIVPEVRRRLDASDTCPVPPDPGWSAGEAWAWEEICAGRIADMSRFDPGDAAGCAAFPGDPEAEKETWPTGRVLSARFIRQIATLRPYTAAPAIRAVRLRCAVIAGQLDLGEARLPQTLWIHDSRLPDAMTLQNARIEGEFSLNGSAVAGRFDAHGMTVTGNFYLRNGRFPGAGLIGAKIGRSLEAVGSSFTGQFNADRMRVGGGLFMSGGANFAGVDLLGAEIGGDGDATGSTFTGLFNADGMRVGGSLFLGGGAKFAGVRLRDAEIGWSVEAVGSTFTGLFDASGAQVGGGLYLRDGATFARIDLPGTRIGGSAQFQGSRVDGPISMNDAQVADQLVLSRQGQHPVWGAGASLGLRNASVGALQAVMPNAEIGNAVHSWRRDDGQGGHEPLPADLSNFRYERLGGWGAGAATDISRIRAPDLIAWVAQSVPDGMTGAEGYAPQPYSQLAATLRAMGAEAAAEAVDYARFVHRAQTRREWWLRPVDWLNRWVVGFGVHPERALWWFAGLVGLGWLVAARSPDLRAKGLWQRFFFSLENSLPLIELSGQFADIRHDGAPRVANFFHFQKAAGFILATVLVGALTILGG